MQKKQQFRFRGYSDGEKRQIGYVIIGCMDFSKKSDAEMKVVDLWLQMQPPSPQRENFLGIVATELSKRGQNGVERLSIRADYSSTPGTQR